LSTHETPIQKKVSEIVVRGFHGCQIEAQVLRSAQVEATSTDANAREDLCESCRAELLRRFCALRRWVVAARPNLGAKRVSRGSAGWSRLSGGTHMRKPIGRRRFAGPMNDWCSTDRSRMAFTTAIVTAFWPIGTAGVGGPPTCRPALRAAMDT